MPELRDYAIFWADLAVHDLDQITSYVALENPLQAYKLWQRIYTATERLSTVPLRCRILPELKEIGVETYRELIVDVYRIMIKAGENSVWILGVFDSRRDLEDIFLLRIMQV